MLKCEKIVTHTVKKLANYVLLTEILTFLFRHSAKNLLETNIRYWITYSEEVDIVCIHKV